MVSPNIVDEAKFDSVKHHLRLSFEVVTVLYKKFNALLLSATRKSRKQVVVPQWIVTPKSSQNCKFSVRKNIIIRS